MLTPQADRWTWLRAESVMDQRLRNWGEAMRGGYPDGRRPDDAVRTPDLLDADVVEPAMVACKCERPGQYEVMHWLYIVGRSDIEVVSRTTLLSMVTLMSSSKTAERPRLTMRASVSSDDRRQFCSISRSTSLTTASIFSCSRLASASFDAADI